jgi:hypothetical protein
VKLCQEKNQLIEIYNAVANKDYPLSTKIEIATVENILYVDRRYEPFAIA